MSYKVVKINNVYKVPKINNVYKVVYEAENDVPSGVRFIRNEDLENAVGLPVQSTEDDSELVIPATALAGFKSIPIRTKVYDNNYRLTSDTVVNGVPNSNSDASVEPDISRHARWSDEYEVSQVAYLPVFYVHTTYPNSSSQSWCTNYIEEFPLYSTLQELENAIDNGDIEDDEGDVVTRNHIAFILKVYWDSSKEAFDYNEIYLSSNVVYTPAS